MKLCSTSPPLKQAVCRFDRTGDHVSRVKMSQDLASAINDGLHNYEDELWDPSDEEAWVGPASSFTEVIELGKFLILRVRICI